MLETLVSEVEEVVAGRTCKTHNSLIHLVDAMTIGIRRGHLVTKTVLNYYTMQGFRLQLLIAQSEKCTDLRLNVVPPGFFGLKILSTCNTGKKL